MPRCLDVIFNSIDAYKATKFVFKSDRLNGFESQSKADAMRERQKEINEKIKESGRIGTPRTRCAYFFLYSRKCVNITMNFQGKKSCQ